MVANRFAVPALLFALALFFTTPYQLKAQDPDDGKKKKEKKEKPDKEKSEFKGSPEKLMEIANELYNQERYSRAKEAYIEVLKQDPDNYTAAYRVGKCSFFIQEYEDAARFFDNAIDLGGNKVDTVLFEYGVVLRILDRHNDALEYFTMFRKKWKNKDAYYRRVKLEIKGCEFVEEERKKEPEYEVKCLDFNSSEGDQFPSIWKRSEEDTYMSFTTSRPEKGGSKKSDPSRLFEGYGEGYSDVWIVKMEDDSTFGKAERVGKKLGKKINTKLNDGNTTFSPDGRTMYYSICNQGKLGYGCSIYEARWDDRKGRWRKPTLVESLKGEKEVVINTRGKTKKVPTYDVHPMLSSDGNTMFFVSDRDGGYGGNDIWYSTFQGDEWSEPMNLGARINTPWNEMSPYLNEDGTILYFSSRGHVGFGGLDLFMSEGGIGRWGDPVNLGAPINSTYDDFAGIWLNEGDSLAYFTSNRDECAGRDDIFIGRKIPEPPKQYQVHGKVLDEDTGLPIPFATVMLFQVDLDEELIPIDTFRTGPDAEYNFPLDGDSKYMVVGNAPEYLASDKEFNTDRMGPEDLEVNVNIKLERIIIDDVISLPNIYYDFDDYALREESVTELNNLIALLDANPNVIILIGSHTDSNGSEDYNKTLSENRAKSVVNFLINNGVSDERLNWFGWGESQLLIYPEKNDKDEQMNRRTEFQILSIDYMGGDS